MRDTFADRPPCLTHQQVLRRGPALTPRFWRRLVRVVIGLLTFALLGVALRQAIVMERCTPDPAYARGAAR